MIGGKGGCILSARRSIRTWGQLGIWGWGGYGRSGAELYRLTVLAIVIPVKINFETLLIELSKHTK